MSKTSKIEPSGEHRDTGRDLAVTAGAVAAAAALCVTGAVAASAVLARRAVQSSRRIEHSVEVIRLGVVSGKDVVWLQGADVGAPGGYSFLFDDERGHAKLGPVIARRNGAVARPVIEVGPGSLRVGARGRLTGWWYRGPAELGFRTEQITYETELGTADAWIVYPRRSRKRRWAVHVHGRGARPAEALRGIVPLAEAGVTNLLISYRNDPGAPRGVRGRYGNGVSESRDVDAAISEAVRRGAERVTLVGWSMGGTACLLAATEGTHSGVVDGLILDSPAVDWTALLRDQASGYRAPKSIADLGMRMLASGIVGSGEPRGLDVSRLNPEAFARGLEVPVLIHASRGDGFVRSGGAERLAELRPDLVQLALSETGGHVRIWNVDPEAWESRTLQFARALPRPAWREPRVD